VLQENEKMSLSETSEAKKKRRNEKKKNKMGMESKTSGIVVTQTTRRSGIDPHEDRRSVSVLTVGQDAMFGWQCEEYHHYQQQTQSCELRTIEEDDEHTSIRKELKAARAKVVQLKQERDIAVDKATRVSIQLVDLKVETDKSLDQLTAQLTESHALVEQMRTMRQQGSPRSVVSSNRSVVSSNRSVMSSNADEIVEACNPFYL
jgi:hypothetical protein